VKTLKIWYRALLPDGRVWCESASERECVDQGALSVQPVHYEQMHVMVVDGPWEPYTPSEVLLKEAEEFARLRQEELEMEE
jgi:hypothetical protein